MIAYEAVFKSEQSHASIFNRTYKNQIITNCAEKNRLTNRLFIEIFSVIKCQKAAK